MFYLGTGLLESGFTSIRFLGGAGVLPELEGVELPGVCCVVVLLVPLCMGSFLGVLVVVVRVLLVGL